MLERVSKDTSTGQISSNSQTCKTMLLPTLDTPVLVTQLNHSNPHIKPLIRNNCNIIQNTDELKKIFKDKPLVGYRRLPNLKDLLTKASITYPLIENTEIKKYFSSVCTRLRKCTYCPKVNHIISYHSKKAFKCVNLPPKHKYTCELRIVIYIIKWTECCPQYIGETKRPVRQRMYEHYRSVQTFNAKKTLYPCLWTLYTTQT